MTIFCYHTNMVMKNSDYTTIQVPKNKKVVEKAKRLASMLEKKNPITSKVAMWAAIDYALTESLKKE